MDSGGDAGFGGTRRKVRTKLRGYIPIGGTGGGGGGGKGETHSRPRPESISPITDPITPTIPQIMNGIFVEVFTAAELIYYLQRMAHLIQMTQDEDFATRVEKDFDGVTPDSVFTALQRKIRLKAPGNAAADPHVKGTDHHIRALHAFQAGSSKWALAATKAKDIVRVTVGLVAAAVRTRVDAQLPLSARAILEEYVALVVSSMIGGDETLAPFGDKMRVEYRAKLDAFFAKFKGSQHWVESRIPKTMESFPDALR